MAFTPSPGTGDLIDVNPQFVDISNGNFSLLPTSPCIATGKYDYDRGAVWYTDRPKAVEQIDAQILPGNEIVTLSWKNPTELLSGIALNGQLTAHIMRNDSLLTSLNNLQVSDSVSYQDNLTEPGNYHYTVYVEENGNPSGWQNNTARMWGGGMLEGIIVWALDSTDVSANALVQSLQELNYGKHVFVTNDPHEYELNTDIDAVFVFLGAQPNYYFLGDGASDRLIPYLFNGGRVYLEGGDFWADAGQQALPINQFFHVSVIGQGNNPVTAIEGFPGSIMDGLSFNYSGNGNSLDDLWFRPDAEMILRNPADGYGGAIAYTDPIYNYRTIGTSFRFGNLIDGTSPNTKTEYIRRVLTYFDLLTNIPEEKPLVAHKFEVLRNYPNPFNGSTTIRYYLENSTNVTLEIFNTLGRKVSSYYFANKSPGENSIKLNLENLDSGIYFYRIMLNDNGNNSVSRMNKMILVK